MARIFITGSADGLGRMAAELLVEQGHRVVLHARSQARADETKRNVPEAEAVVIGDGLSHVFAVNTIAPYILTALIAKPKRTRLSQLDASPERRQSQILLASMRSFFFLAAAIARSISGCATFTAAA